MLDFFVQFFTDYGYIAVFGILILCGFGLPVPEDITLVSGGVISGLDYTNVHVMCVVGLAGVLIGDSVMFLAGRLFGYRIQRIRLFRRILSPRRFSQIQRKFKQYGLGLLFVARFLPGLRSPIFLVSGMSRRVSFLTFILMDGFAALISVPVWIYLGFFFADNLDLLMEYVGDVQKAIYLALGVLVLVIVVIYLKKRFHSKLNAIAGEDHGHATTKQASVEVADKSAQATNTASQVKTNEATTQATSAQPCPCEQESKLEQESKVKQENKLEHDFSHSTVIIEPMTETHEEILGRQIKDKKLISQLSKASSLAASGKGHSKFNPGIPKS